MAEHRLTPEHILSDAEKAAYLAMVELWRDYSFEHDRPRGDGIRWLRSMIELHAIEGSTPERANELGWQAMFEVEAGLA